MLHSRRSSLEVASSKGLLNASTKEMIGRPALKSFPAWAMHMQPALWVCVERPKDIGAEVHAWLPAGLFVQLPVEILCHFL